MNAWLVIVAGDNRQHGGNKGYADDPASYYSWDSTVPNHDAVKVGDVIVLWDKKVLLGASVIEAIEEHDGEKDRFRCPACGKTAFKPRKNRSPVYKCQTACGAEFDRPTKETIRVHTYRSRHESAWTDLDGQLDGATLRSLCISTKSMHSIRLLDWEQFKSSLGGVSAIPTGTFELTHQLVTDGHCEAMVRVRRGQGAFRRGLLERFGSVCAFTGPQPPAVLDAGHLYSYSTVGKHDLRGGLLLRKDIHRLFDVGLLCVRANGEVDVSPKLAGYSEYSQLDGCPLVAEISAACQDWLAAHWNQHRAPI